MTRMTRGLLSNKLDSEDRDVGRKSKIVHRDDRRDLSSRLRHWSYLNWIVCFSFGVLECQSCISLSSWGSAVLI